MNRPKLALVIVLLLCLAAEAPSSAVGVAASSQGTKKPAVAPKKPIPEQLYERTKSTLSRAIKEIEDVRASRKAAVEAIGSPSEIGPGLADRIRPYVSRIDSDYALWKGGKLADHDFLRELYLVACESCTYAYKGHITGLEGALTAGWLVHQRDVINDSAIKAANSQLALVTDPDRAAKQAAIWSAMADQMNAGYRDVWSQFLQKSRALQDELDHARKRWGPELWEYYGFADQESSMSTDAHAGAKGTIRMCLDQTFKQPEMPLQQILNWGVAAPVQRASVEGTTGYLFKVLYQSQTVSYVAGGVGGDQPIWKSVPVDPVVQIVPNDPGAISLGIGLQPSVDGLRGYKEVEESAAIYDCVILPTIDPKTSLPATGPIRPFSRPGSDGSDTYIFMVYGSKAPTSADKLKSLISDDGNKIQYKAVGFLKDIQDKTIMADLKNLWDMARESVRVGMDEANLKDFDDLPSMLIEAHLTPGLLPGYHTFKLNGAEGAWAVHYGTTHARINFIRELNDDPNGAPIPNPQTEVTNCVYPDESLMVELKTGGPVGLKEVKATVGIGNVWQTFDGDPHVVLSLVPGTDNIYRSKKIQIVPHGDKRLDWELKNNGRKPNTLYLAVDPGDELQCKPEHSSLFKYDRFVSTAEALQSPEPSRWVDALSRAAKADGRFGNLPDWSTLPSQTVEEVSNTILTEVLLDDRNQRIMGYRSPPPRTTVSNRILLGDQAAAILLRDEFMVMMRPVLDELEKQKTDTEKIAYMRGLASEILAPDSPMGRIQVRVPRSSQPGDPLLNSAAPTAPLRIYFSNDLSFLSKESDPQTWINGALISGFNQYSASVKNALDKANALKDGDIDGLLDLAGNGFSRVIAELTPKLMKPVKNSSGGYTMVPDYPARAWVNGLNAAFEAITAQHQYSALDTQVVLALASLIPMVGPAGLAKTILQTIVTALFFGDVVAGQIPEYFEKESEYRFAFGASKVLGTERFYMADMQRMPMWALMLNIVGAGVAGLGSAHEMCGLIAKLSRAEAALTATEALAKLRNGGLKEFAALSKEERAAVYASIMEAEKKEIALGASALSEHEQQLKALKAKILEEFKEFRPKTALVPQKDVLKPLKGIKTVELPTPSNYIPTSIEEGSPLEWVGPDRKTYMLERIICQESTFCDVYKVFEKNLVLKIVKAVGNEAKQTWAGMKLAKKVLDKYKIPYKALTFAEADQFGYVLQDMVTYSDEVGKESFIVDQFLKRNGALTPEMQDAIMDLVDLMKRNNVAFEDFKFNNIYIERVGGPNGKLVCGVVDVDRLAEWGALEGDCLYFATTMEYCTGEGNIRSVFPRVSGLDPELFYETRFPVQTERLIQDCEEFWELQLERKGIVTYRQGGFTSIRVDNNFMIHELLDMKKVTRVLPRLKTGRIINMATRTPYTPKPPPPGPPLLLMLTGVSCQHSCSCVDRLPMAC